MVVLLLFAGVHGWLVATLPEPKLLGDETNYLEHAYGLVEDGRDTLLIGRLSFDETLTGRGAQPMFCSHVYAQFLEPRDPGDDSLPVPRSLFAVQLVIYLALLLTVWWTAAELRLGPRTRTAAVSLLAVFPWHGFFVHALWPEVIHALLLQVVMASCLRFLNGRDGRWLVLGGAAMAYAAVTKATFGSYAWPLSALVLGLAWWGARADRGRALLRAGQALLLPLVFHLALGAQLSTNEADGHGRVVGYNRFWALSWGSTLPAPGEIPGTEGLDHEAQVLVGFWTQLYANYARGETIQEREAIAREIFFDHWESAPVLDNAARQVRKLGWMVRAGRSMFDNASEFERWGPGRVSWIGALRTPARWLWWGVLGLGLAGVAALGWRERGALVLSSAVGFQAVVAFMIPAKPRFLMPAVPILVLFAAALLVMLWARARRAEEPPGARAIES